MTPDSLHAIASDQRVARQSALLLPLDSAQLAAANCRFSQNYADLLPREAPPAAFRFQPSAEPNIHVTQVLGTRQGLSASIRQATTRIQVMARH